MAQLRWNYGTMNSGKSTLALQLDHTHRSSGLKGVLFSKLDRGGAATITSRVGLSADAVDATGRNLFTYVRDEKEQRGLDYVIADEAQFYTRAQVDELARIVDDLRVPVHAFGLRADFRSQLFEASARMFEIADECIPLPVQALCWCSSNARMNARVVGGLLQRDGETVVVGDIGAGEVSYVLLCRAHYVAGVHTKPASVVM